MAQKPLLFEGRVTVHATAAALWPLVSDTDRLNRVAGLPPTFYVAEPRPEGGSRVTAEYRLGPLPLARWEEGPFQWQAPHHYSVERRYALGPLAAFRGGMDLAPVGDRATQVRVWAELTPRNVAASLLVRTVVGPRGIAASLAQVRIFERYLRGDVDTPFPQLRRPPFLARLADRLFASGFRETAALPASLAPTLPPSAPLSPSPPAADAWTALVVETGRPDLVEPLQRIVREASDPELVKMRPFALADLWDQDRHDVLVLFLRATTAGLFVMTWDVLCPHCRAAKASYRSLADVQPQAHCGTCNFTYEVDPEHNVEVRFTVAPHVRAVKASTFCAAGPLNTPHRLAQLTLGPGETGAIHLPLEPGPYQVRSLQSRGTCLVRAVATAPAPNPGEARPPGSEVGPTVDVYADRLVPATLLLPAGDIQLEVHNHRREPVVAELERPGWADTAATAAYVSGLKEFRDLFSAEVLAPGVQVAIQRLTVLFTDLAGSTALYQTLGQAPAFRFVQEHFRALFRTVDEHQGTVVKTIGDAVMATFPTPHSGFAAALAMQAAMRELNRAMPGGGMALLKVGLHEGPCLAATANERMDYFGTTVNIAARVQSEARGGEITFTEPIRQDPAVAARLATLGVALDVSPVQLRGIEAPVDVYRLASAESCVPEAVRR